MTSARTLADITDERVVPVDYLGVLMLLFLLLVLDRLFYTLGLHLGKVRSTKHMHLSVQSRQCCACRRQLDLVLAWQWQQGFGDPHQVQVADHRSDRCKRSMHEQHGPVLSLGVK